MKIKNTLSKVHHDVVWMRFDFDRFFVHLKVINGKEHV
jgi:hypothetical protein